MNKTIPLEIKIPINSDVLNKLEGTSCHSDIIGPIESHLSTLEGVKSFCPNWESFSYILWYANNVVFAYANGMEKITIRLSQSGNLNFEDAKKPKSFTIEDSWYSIPYDSKNLIFLINSAYASAKNS